MLVLEFALRGGGRRSDLLIWDLLTLWNEGVQILEDRDNKIKTSKDNKLLTISHLEVRSRTTLS